MLTFRNLKPLFIAVLTTRQYNGFTAFPVNAEFNVQKLNMKTENVLIIRITHSLSHSLLQFANLR